MRAAEGNKCRCSAMSSGVHCSASALQAVMPRGAEGPHSRGREEICGRPNVYLAVFVGGKRDRAHQASIAAAVNWCFSTGCDSSMAGQTG